MKGALGEEVEGGLMVGDGFKELCCVGHILLKMLFKEGPDKG